MNQVEYIKQQSDFWKSCEQLLSSDKNRSELPETYRVLSHQLAVAESRNYSPGLINYLQKLVLDYHSQLYRQRTNWFQSLWLFFYYIFPNSLRNNNKVFAIAATLFFLPLILTSTIIYFYPDHVYYFLSIEKLADIKDMYNPENAVLGRERTEDGDWYMFGFYLYNNTSIGFRTFAAGLLMGFGSAFFLLFNGVFIGVIAGYLINIGYSETFFSFVSGHSSFELVAIALSGAAGLMLGQSLINPGNLQRKLALQKAAKSAMPIMQGAMSFFFIAAAIEAFWSSSQSTIFIIKIAVGIIFWLSIAGYFLFAGRNKHAK